MLIAFSGKKGSGKDTCAVILDFIAKSEGMQTYTVGFADAMKSILGMIFRVNPKIFYDNKDTPNESLNGKTPRDVLISFAKWVRETKDDAWVSHVQVALESLGGPDKLNMVTDLRHVIEYEALRGKGAILVRVIRTGTENEDDISETALDDHEFDYVVYNNGTILDLTKTLQKLWQDIKDKEQEHALSFS
jgi:hypothetical protein